MSEYLGTATILYVEDDTLTNEAYTRVLTRYSKELYVAYNGEEGLALYKKHNPDIVISDIRMPKMDGLEMVRLIREMNNEQVIIFTSAYNDSEYTLKALDLNVNAYILKPVDKRVLKQKIDTFSKNIALVKENTIQKNILNAIMDNQSTMTFLTDCKSIIYSSNSFLDFYNFKNNSEFFTIYNDFFSAFIPHEDYLHAQNIENFLKVFRELDKSKRVVLLMGKDFTPKAFQIDIKPLYIDNKEVYLFSLTDITDLREQQIKIEHKAYYDNLTAIYNRNKLEEFFQAEMIRAKRYKRNLSLAILDIDHFKKVNDTYGHLAGDEVLIALAQRVSKKSRETDIFARWGGEEFVLLMPETSTQEAMEMCEHLRHEITLLNHPTVGKISCSFGISQVNEDDTKESVFKRCDDALYKAKNNGRNRVEIA